MHRTSRGRRGFKLGVPGAGSGDPGRSAEVREHVRADGVGRWIPGRRQMGKTIEGKTMDVIREGAGRRVAVCRMLVCSGHDYLALHLLATSVVGPGPGGRTGRRVVSCGRTWAWGVLAKEWRQGNAAAETSFLCLHSLAIASECEVGRTVAADGSVRCPTSRPQATSGSRLG
jgi:hypothetical protein